VKLLMDGEVLSCKLTKAGKAQRVIVADGDERNAVLIVPPGVKINSPLVGFPVHAQVSLTVEGVATKSIVYMADEGWPSRAAAS
jgi:hypothetical protein